MKRLLIILFISWGVCSIVAAQQKSTQPNIIIILSDDHAYQTISAYGSTLMQTPNIDRLSREGALFTNAYVTNSICGPSRAVILTGRYSHKNGFKDNETSDFNSGQDSFAKQLQAKGYQTAWIGKYHLGEDPQGFDFWQLFPGQGSYYNPDMLMMDGSTKRIEGYATNITEDIAESWLDQRDKSKPFCLIIGHKSTHRTWLPDTVDMGRFDNVHFPLPANFYDDYQGRAAAKVQDMTIAKTMLLGYDLKMLPTDNNEGSITRMNAAQRAKFDAYYQPIFADFKSRNLSGNALTEWKFQRYMKDYLSTATSLDRNIGRTLDYLDRNGLTQNTLVIYMSDQGFYMGEHGWFDKRFMYKESFRTPMLLRYPYVVKPGTVVKSYVMNLDIAPTLLNVAGVPVPDSMQGQSFLPQLTDKKVKERDAMYYHYYENGEHSVSPHFGVQTKRYKLIRFYKRVNSWELYDLEKDPHDMHNLYGKKGYDVITRDMKARLNEMINRYEDEDAMKILSDK
ncbi:MAG TPA: sulfatase [Agriterribacter sp.]|nr:sulfatase [Agriterribacter sp.]